MIYFRSNFLYRTVTVVFAFVYLPSFFCEINNVASCSKVAIPGEALKRKGETADKNKEKHERYEEH